MRLRVRCFDSTARRRISWVCEQHAPTDIAAAAGALTAVVLPGDEKYGRFRQNLHGATGTNVRVSLSATSARSSSAGTPVHRLLWQVVTCTLATLAVLVATAMLLAKRSTTCWSNDASRCMG